MTTSTATRERADLVAALQKARFFLKFTCRDLTDEQAALRPTVSRLCLGGLVKHVTDVERNWQRFVLDGPAAFPAADDPQAQAERDARFAMQPGDTLAGVLAAYDEQAAVTDAMVGEVDLDAEQPLPAAPWFPPGARWSARQVLLHIVAETAQHAGHADIVREAIDGAKSMG